MSLAANGLILMIQEGKWTNYTLGSVIPERKLTGDQNLYQHLTLGIISKSGKGYKMKLIITTLEVEVMYTALKTTMIID